MSVLGEWNGHQFVVSENLIKSFSDLTITGGVDTNPTNQAVNSYVKVKNAQPYKITMKVALNALVGADVRKEAVQFVQEAGRGACNYLVIGGERVIASQVMLTEAELSNIQMTGNGKWVCCDVALTFTQGSGTTAAAASGSGSSSGAKDSGAGKKDSASTQKVNPIVTNTNAAKKAANTTTTKQSTAVTVNNIKKTQAAQKATTAKGGGGTAGVLLRKAMQ